MKIKNLSLLGLLLFLGNIVTAQVTSADLQMLQKAFQMEKRAIVKENMNLTTDEADQFWSIYDSYEKDLAEISGPNLKLLKEYLENYNTITDERAAFIIEEGFKSNAKIQKIRKKYYKMLKKQMSVTHAVRFSQVEAMIRSLSLVNIYKDTPLLDYK